MTFADVQIGQTVVLIHGIGRYKKLDENHALCMVGNDSVRVRVNIAADVSHICE